MSPPPAGFSDSKCCSLYPPQNIKCAAGTSKGQTTLFRRYCYEPVAPEPHPPGPFHLGNPVALDTSRPDHIVEGILARLTKLPPPLIVLPDDVAVNKASDYFLVQMLHHGVAVDVWPDRFRVVAAQTE